MERARNDFYVVTGAPSSGKTSVVEYLATQGFMTVPEIARVYINDQISKGKDIRAIRGDEAAFQQIVLAKKLRAEAALIRGRQTFLDRAVPDSIAYYRLKGLDPSPAIDASTVTRYRGIFLMEPLTFIPDYARTETPEQQLQLHKLLEEAYQELGYQVWKIPVMPIAQRGQLMLDHVIGM